MPTATVQASSERNLLAAGVLSATAIVLLLVVPRTSPAVTVLLVLLAAVTSGAAVSLAPLKRMAVPAALLLGLAAWGLLSIVWAHDRAEAASKSAMLAAFTVAVAWAQLTLKDAHPELLRHAARAALIAFAAGLAYLCLEEITGHILKRAVFYALPFTRPSGKHIFDVDGDLAVSSYISNRNMAASILALWPMLLIVRAIIDRGRQLPALSALVIMAVLALSLSKHETSLFALVLSAMVFAACSKWPKVGLGMVAAGWLVATLLVVPLASWASHGAGLHHASWLPLSARHRIVLWAYTAEQVQQRPLTGIGAASTKALDAARGPMVEVVAGTKFQWRSGPHAHNVYLQTWYELGAIGAALLCAAGLAMVALLGRLPAAVMPFAAATMTAAAVTAAFSYGMWQPWFVGIFAVSAVLTGVGVTLGRRSEPSAGLATAG